MIYVLHAQSNLKQQLESKKVKEIKGQTAYYKQNEMSDSSFKAAHSPLEAFISFGFNKPTLDHISKINIKAMKDFLI